MIDVGVSSGEKERQRSAAASADRWWVQWPWIALAVGGAALLTLLAAVPDIFIPDTSLGWVDVWYYVGFALRLPETLRRCWYLYQSERIAWTLPAYVVNLVASPLAANYLLKSIFFLATVLFLFGAVRQTCTLRTAVFVSALAALYSFFVHSLGAGYADGPANTYLLMTIWFANRMLSGTGRTRVDACLAGACYGALLLAHFVFIVVLPILVVYALLARAESPLRHVRVWTLVPAFAAGAAATIAAAAALYAVWNVPSRPLQASFQVFFAHNPNTLIWPNSRRWIFRAFWLVLPSAVAAWSVLAVVRAPGGGWSLPRRLPPVDWLLISIYGSWAAMYLAKAPWIILPFYVSYFIPAMFLALGPIVMRPLESLSSPMYRWLLGLLFTLAAIGYRFSEPRFDRVAVVAAVTCLGAATWLRFGRRALTDRGAPAFLALLVIAVAALNYATADYATQLRNAYRHTRMASIYYEPPVRWRAPRSETYNAAIEAANVLTPRLLNRRYYFWYDSDDPLGMFFRSLSSMFFAWSTDALLSERFRDFDEEDLKLVSAGDARTLRDLVILTRSADLFFRDSRLQLLWKEEFRIGPARYFVHYFGFQAPTVAGGRSAP